MDFGRRTVVLRAAGLALRWQVRAMGWTVALWLLTIVMTGWALTQGDYPLSLAQVWSALAGDADAGFHRIVVVEWRAPRAVAAVVFGAALGLAGAVFQSLTRNPLASPDIIGFSTGSYTGALIVIVLIGGTYAQLAAGAVVGGLVTAAVVYVLAWRRGVQGFRLIIVGIAVSAMLTSFNTWLLLTAELEVALSASAWGVGSLTGIGWTPVAWAGGLVVVLSAALVPLSPGLRQLELGDDAARASGVRVEPVRLAVVVVGVALTATVTAAAGPVMFVALAAPQIARRLTRAQGIPLVAAAATGALMLAAADAIAQHALPVALPVGVVTVVIGGSYLIWLIIREARRRA